MAGKQVQVLNSSNAQINVGSEEALILLRRMVKLMESQGTVDSNNRQRIVVEGATITTMPASTTVYMNNIPVDQRFELIDRARHAYAVGIRANLQFS